MAEGFSLEEAYAPQKSSGAAEPVGFSLEDAYAQEAKKPSASGGYFTDLVDSLFGSSDQNKSVLEKYQPTPQEQSAEVQRRLNLGAGPISKETAGKADLLRSGVLPKEEVTPRIQKAAKAMAEQGSFSLADAYEMADRARRVEESQSFEKQHPIISEIGKEAIGNIEAIPAVVSNLIPYPMVGGAISALNEMGGVAARRLLQNKEITGEDFDRISQAYDRVEQGLTYQPRTERGQERTEDVNSVVQNYVIPGLMAMEGLPPIHIRPSVDYIHAQTKDLLSKGVPPEQIPSYIHQSNLPMYEALAKSKGFLTPEAKAEAPVVESAPAITPVAAPAAPVEAPQVIAPPEVPVINDRQQKIDAEIAGLRARGIDEDAAKRIAERRVSETESQVATQDVVDQETGEITNVARPNAEPVGAGAEVAVEPSGGAAEGIGQPERNGNVPAVEDVGHVAAGEGQQPSALTEEASHNTFEAEKENARDVGERNAQTAFDTRDSYENLEEAIGAHRDNVQDTLVEQGKHTDPNWAHILDTAQGAFDEHVDRLRENEAKKAETPKVEEAKEEPSGTETHETVEAKSEEPQAAAAEPVTEAPASEEPAVKRGRPPLALTPEERIAKVQEKKLQRSAYMKDDRAIAKYSDQLEEAIKPLDEGEYKNDEALAEAQNDQRANKLDAVRNLLEIEQRQRGTAAGKRAKDILNNRNKITQAEIDNIKRGNEVRKRAGIANKDDFLGTATTPLSSTTGITADTADTRFSKFSNGAQALSHIAKTGNAFERVLAQRLRKFVNNVKFTVVEDGDVLHPDLIKHSEDWNLGRAMYIRDPITGEGRVYARGTSFGNDHGISNTTVLHEMLHAALQQKIDLAMQALERGHSLDSKLVNAYHDLEKIVEEAKAEYIRKLRAGEDIPARIDSLIDHSEFFENPHEFISYSLTEPVVQRFLMDAIGKKKESLFTKFVNFAREALGMGKGDINALSDLLSVTDTALSARKTADMKLVEQGDMQAHALDAARTNRPPLLAAKEHSEEVTKGLRTVVASRDGEQLGKSVSMLQLLREPSRIWPEIKLAWGSLDSSSREAISHFYDAEAIAHGGPGEAIPAFKDVYTGMQQMSGQTQVFMRSVAREAEAIVDFFRAHPKERDNFTDLLNASTLDGYDPSKTNKTPNKVLDDRYNALPQQGKDLYKQLIALYKDFNDFRDDTLRTQIERLDLPPDARTAVMAQLREIYEGGDKIEPYFPLHRFGDYVLDYGKGDSRVSIRFDTAKERNRAAANYAKTLSKSAREAEVDGDIVIKDDVNGIQLRSKIEENSKMLKAVYEAIDKASVTDSTTKGALKDALYQSYLAAMPEQSVRKLFIHRKGVAGFSSDILRTVNDTGARMAKQLARLKYAPEITRSLEAARRQLEGNKELTPFLVRMNSLVGDSIQPKPVSLSALDYLVGGLTKYSYLRYLTSWSSALMQPLDIFLKAGPLILANHGPKGVAELSKALKFWGETGTMGMTETLPDGRVKYRAPSIEYSKGLTELQRDAVRAMIRYGVTTDTLTNEVFQNARKTTKTVDSKAVALAKNAGSTLIFGGLMHHGERLSREVVYFAAYNSSFAEGLAKGLKAPEAHEAAIQQAVRETNEAFGNYAAWNRPMMMRGPLGKLTTQFKMFPFVTTKILVNNFFKMLPLLNKEAKVEAATKFFGVMLTHTLSGGLNALPAFSLVASLIGAAWIRWGKDPDAPEDMRTKDPELWFRTQLLPSIFGHTGLAKVIEMGPINYFLGLNVSDRLSLNDMWFRAPTPGRTVRESALKWGVTVFGGAGVNATLGAADGYSSLMNGEIEKGLEQLAPASISSLMAAYRYTTTGMTDAFGRQIVAPKNVKPIEVAGQAIGFRPARFSEAQNIAIKENAVQTQIKNERADIEKQLVNSFNAGDTERFNKVAKDMNVFNMHNPEHAFDWGSVVDTLLSSAENKANAEANAGIVLGEKNFRLAYPAVEYSKENLTRGNKK